MLRLVRRALMVVAVGVPVMPAAHVAVLMGVGVAFGFPDADGEVARGARAVVQALIVVMRVAVLVLGAVRLVGVRMAVGVRLLIRASHRYGG